MELLCIIIKAFIWLSQPLSVRQIYMRFSSLPEKMSAGCLPYFPWLHFPAAVALGLTGWWWGWEVFQISNSNCHFIMFVYLYWHSFCVAALNPIQERKVLGCIMGNTTFNRSLLFWGAVKIKLTLNKSNAKLLSDVNPPPEPWSLFFWPCNSICFVVALVLVWQQTDQRKMGSWHTHSAKNLCTGEIWGGSQKDCLFQERKKVEKVTPVTQTSVLFLVEQGMEAGEHLVFCVLQDNLPGVW